MLEGDRKRKEAVEAARAALTEATGEINELVETPAETPQETPSESSGEAPVIETPSERSSPEVERLQREVNRLNSILDDENNSTYKSRWQVLQGMWKKQEDEITTLKAEITRLSTEKPKPAETEEDPDYLSDVEEWGESAAKKNQKMRAKQRQLEEQAVKTQRELEALREKSEQVGNTATYVANAQAMTEQERYYTKLSSEVPNWQELNGDGSTTINPKFAAFLTSTLPGGDEDYNTVLQRNHNKGNVGKVIEIFNIFNKATGLTTNKPKPSSKAEKFLEPGKTGQGTTEPSDKVDVVTRSEINKFRQSSQYKDFKGTQAEREALRAKYRKAELEGRVVEDVK